MSRNAHDFEKPLFDLTAQLEGLRAQPQTEKSQKEIEKLEKKLLKKQTEIFANLSDWQHCQVARHPDRPYTRDYIEGLVTSFEELHGDRRFADDPAIIGGFGQFGTQTVCWIGHQKGRTLEQKLHRNFGMPRPEGYRKALRLMKLAEKFHKPIICTIDTPGAYPGIDAEERGQAEAIALNLMVMARLATPILCLIIGEGGSGGALALGIGDHVCMLENSIYSVISPEGCASILWKDAGKMEQAAEALHLTASKMKALALIDQVIPEPPGGAHAQPQEMIRLLGDHIGEWLAHGRGDSVEEMLQKRHRKFRAMGQCLGVDG